MGPEKEESQEEGHGKKGKREMKYTKYAFLLLFCGVLSAQVQYPRYESMSEINERSERTRQIQLQNTLPGQTIRANDLKLRQCLRQVYRHGNGPVEE
jgi:hypothetical protein